MGYSFTRFIEQVDDEFHCQICKLVLQNPVETPCEHFFCDECIKVWLSVEEICPLDRQSLTTADLKPPSRLMRSLIGKLNIKCEFRDDGCPEILRLDNLDKHCGICICNPAATVTCDKGCGQKITRRDYFEWNCMVHLEKTVKGQQEEITQLTAEINLLSSERSAAENVIDGLRQQIVRLQSERDYQRSENMKRDNVIDGLKKEIAELNEKVAQQQAKITKETVNTEEGSLSAYLKKKYGC